MAGATARLALPYPVPADTVDVPRDVQALADKLDTITAIAPPLVTALPGSPVDGQMCILQTAAMAAKAVAWHLRYRAGGGTNKWEFIGGPPMYAQQSAGSNQSTAAIGTFAQMTNTPTLVVPASGDYILKAIGVIQANAAGGVDARVAIAENAVNKSGSAWLTTGAQFAGGSYATETAPAALTSGLTLDLRVATNNLQANFGNPTLWMMYLLPIAVR